METNNYNAYVQDEGGELQDGYTISADQLGDYDRSYTLLPEGDYEFTVVNLEVARYQPGPESTGKTGACKQIILTLRVNNPEDGSSVDLRHNLYMWNSKACVGMIAQFYDSIGTHKKGAPLRFDWRKEVIIGKTGKLQLNHRADRKDPSKVYNNIKKLYSKEETASDNNSAGNNNWGWRK